MPNPYSAIFLSLSNSSVVCGTIELKYFFWIRLEIADNSFFDSPCHVTDLLLLLVWYDWYRQANTVSCEFLSTAQDHEILVVLTR